MRGTKQMTEGETVKDYKKENVPFARSLRKNQTRQERKLWFEYLRDYIPRFQRQKPIGDYIVDFYCAKLGLVIELDGGGHYEPEQIEKDAVRTRELESMKLRVVRICNTDVDRNFTAVCDYIDHIVETLTMK